jgi:hypothetical protein
MTSSRLSVSVGSTGWPVVDAAGLATGHLVGGLVPLISSPFLAVDASS